MSFEGHPRQIEGLKSAIALLERPSCIPQPRPRGAKAAGLRFEKSLFAALSKGIRGQWFSFEDKNGPGYCQTDILYSFLPRYMVVIEAKYTLVPGAHTKLVNLYLPVASKALNAPVCGVVVVKNLDPRFRRGQIYTDLPSAAAASYEQGYPTLIQWSGQALLPSSRHSSVRKAA